MTRARLIVIGVAVVLVTALALRYLAYADVGSGCYIFIRLSFVGDSNTTIKRALETLKHGSPDDYRKVCTHVATINPNPSCGGFGGGCFWYNKDNRTRGTIDVSTENGLISTVGIIVHETCHAIQFQEGRPAGHDLETECYREDDRILRALVRFE